MLVPDLINGTFELSGTFFVALGIRQLMRDKQVKGVHWLTVVFFTVWGYWNTWYYPHLGQWISFVGGCGIAVSNTIYVIMLLHYSRRQK